MVKDRSDGSSTWREGDILTQVEPKDYARVQSSDENPGNLVDNRGDQITPIKQHHAPRAKPYSRPKNPSRNCKTTVSKAKSTESVNPMLFWPSRFS